MMALHCCTTHGPTDVSKLRRRCRSLCADPVAPVGWILSGSSHLMDGSDVAKHFLLQFPSGPCLRPGRIPQHAGVRGQIAAATAVRNEPSHPLAADPFALGPSGELPRSFAPLRQGHTRTWQENVSLWLWLAASPATSRGPPRRAPGNRRSVTLRHRDTPFKPANPQPASL